MVPRATPGTGKNDEFSQQLMPQPGVADLKTRYSTERAVARPVLFVSQLSADMKRCLSPLNRLEALRSSVHSPQRVTIDLFG